MIDKTGIIKIFTGKHIDLSKIVSISDAQFENRMGSGGYFVSFEIEAQLLEKPIYFQRRFSYSETQSFEKEYKSEPRYMRRYSSDNEKDIEAVKNLQRDIDVIISQWKEFKRLF